MSRKARPASPTFSSISCSRARRGIRPENFRASSGATAATTTRSPPRTTPAISRMHRKTAWRWSWSSNRIGMANLVLKDQDVTTELAVVQEERRSRIDNEPTSLLAEQMDAALYIAHPYGRPVIGWMSEVTQAHPRRRDRFLPEVLHAEQRDPRGRRRRDRRRGAAAGRKVLRRACQYSRTSTAASHRRAGARSPPGASG